MKIAIDAGHGLHTPGRRCLKRLDPEETREWQLNSRVAEQVCRHLVRCGAEVIRLDDPTGRRDVPLGERSGRANREKCDWCVSIHHNAGVKGGSGGGAVVFVYSGKHSGASDKLAQTIYDKLIEAVGSFGNRAQPLAQKNLHMLRKTHMPSVLVEVGFMDSSADVPKITDPQWVKKAAEGIARGICLTGGLVWREEQGENPYLVKVNTDTLNVRTGAGISFPVTTQIHRGEVYTIVGEQMNGSTKWGRLKSGAGWISLGYTRKQQ